MQELNLASSIKIIAGAAAGWSRIHPIPFERFRKEARATGKQNTQSKIAAGDRVGSSRTHTQGLSKSGDTCVKK